MSDPLYSPEKFKHQLEIIMKREKIIRWREFEKAIGMPGSTYRWRSGRDQPNPESLLKISQRFKVSIDWLLTGEEPGLLQELIPASYETRPLIPVQSGLLGRCIGSVNGTLKDLYRAKKINKLTEDQKNLLIGKVYAQCAEDQVEPDAHIVEKYLLLPD